MEKNAIIRTQQSVSNITQSVCIAKLNTHLRVWVMYNKATTQLQDMVSLHTHRRV